MFATKLKTVFLPSNLNRFRLFHGSAVSNGYALTYEQFGNPSDVLKKVPIHTERSLSKNQVVVQFLASPINPADLNTIQGVYPLKPASFPAIGGNEGVAEVIKIGPDVKNVQIGDKIIPSALASGTWTTHTIINEKDLIVLDPDIDVLFASQITVNPCTAYRMLKDFVSLKEGDTIIQNGGNSAVGTFVIQLAKLWNIKTINVVRNRDDISQLKKNLKSLGADFVVTEEELRKRETSDEILGQVSKPKLALNCIGGQNATDCMRYLADEGVMVTYGGMSKKPVVIPTGAFIFKDHKYVGYWQSSWTKKHQSSATRLSMLKELTNLHKEGKLVIPKTVQISLDEYKDVMDKMQEGFTNAKYVFKFEK